MGAGLGTAQVQVLATFSGRVVGERVEISTLRLWTGLIGTELSRILRTLNRRGCIMLHSASRDRLDVLRPAAGNRAIFVSLTLEGEVYLAHAKLPPEALAFRAGN
jgi:hypothetical protein